MIIFQGGNIHDVQDDEFNDDEDDDVVADVEVVKMTYWC